MEGMQVDQDVGQRVVIGDGKPVAQFGTLNAEFDGLGVDALGGGALLVDLLVGVAVAVELVADTCSDAGGYGSYATFLGPVFVVDRTRFAGGFGEEQGARMPPTFVFDDASGTRDEGLFERHGETGLAERQAVGAEGALVTTLLGKRNRRESSFFIVAVEVLVDVKRIKGGIEGAEAGAEVEAAIDVGHERVKAGDVAAIEGLSKLSQDELSPVRHLGSHHTGAVTPVILAHGKCLGRYRIFERR